MGPLNLQRATAHATWATDGVLCARASTPPADAPLSSACRHAASSTTTNQKPWNCSSSPSPGTWVVGHCCDAFAWPVYLCALRLAVQCCERRCVAMLGKALVAHVSVTSEIDSIRCKKSSLCDGVDAVDVSCARPIARVYACNKKYHTILVEFCAIPDTGMCSPIVHFAIVLSTCVCKLT